MNSDYILNAFKRLNVQPLFALDDYITYSFDLKEEFIIKLDRLFKELKAKGMTKLMVKETHCNYCYPDKPSYEFYNPDTGEFVFRYVIFQESNYMFRVEQCFNKPTTELFF